MYKNAIPVSQQKMRPANSVIYGTFRYTLKAIRCCASYILLKRLGLGINFIEYIPLRLYNDIQFVAVALFVVTPVSKENSLISCSMWPLE